MSTTTNAVIDELRQAVTDGNAGAVEVDPSRLATLDADASGARQGSVLALVTPRSSADVQAVVKVAARHGIPVIAQGARTGLAGAGSGVADGILIDFSRMNAIVRIDPLEQLAVVQPGVTVTELAEAAAAQGMFYAPDPVSAEWATIGGTVATNAGGMRCIKYGVTREAVRSLEVVLADGSLVDTRRDTIKSVAGLDITSLIVGSEGTLALVTEVTVSLLPLPGPTRGVSALFSSLGDALAAANEIATGDAPPSTLELLDDVALAAISAHDPSLSVPEGARAWLLAVTDARVGAEDELAAFSATFASHRALQIDHADTPEELDQLFALRRALHPGLQAYLGGSLNGDIAVPRGALGEVAERAAEIATQYDAVISVGGHVGDGNLHPVVAYNPDDAEQTRRAHEAQAALLDVAQQLGGTITGEHGIGTEKLHALGGEIVPRVRELQLAIKAAFDPQGILNPGRKL